MIGIANCEDEVRVRVSRRAFKVMLFNEDFL